ncbi:hypothetical protein ACOSQ3_012211 [Xanthoceras sorbifolium]
MAAMLITNNVFFNLPQAFPQSSSLRSSRKVSRVYFSTASNYNYNKGRHPVERARGSRDVKAYDSKESVNETDERVSNATGKAGEAVREGVEITKERAEEMKERATEKTKEGTDGVAEATRETKEKAEEFAQAVVKKTEDAAETAAENAKKGTSEAAETAQSLGEKAKQTVESAWGAAKVTTKEIKETVVGKDEGEKTKDKDVK